MVPRTLKATWSAETPVTACLVAWRLPLQTEVSVFTYCSRTNSSMVCQWTANYLRPCHLLKFLWRICNLNGENLREKDFIDTIMKCRVVYCYTVDVGTITKHGCPECVPFAVLNPNSYTEFWNWVVKILIHIQQALALILSTHAVALTDCPAFWPFLLFKYWDIILTQTTAAICIPFHLAQTYF